MTDLSPLRRRMIEDMTVRNLSPATQRSYLHAVSKFSRYFDRSPARLLEWTTPNGHRMCQDELSNAQTREPPVSQIIRVGMVIFPRKSGRG